jgi:hypothetical protein
MLNGIFVLPQMVARRDGALSGDFLSNHVGNFCPRLPCAQCEGGGMLKGTHCIRV